MSKPITARQYREIVKRLKVALKVTVQEHDGGVFCNLVRDNRTNPVMVAFFGQIREGDESLTRIWPMSIDLSIGNEGSHYSDFCFRDFHTVAEVIDGAESLFAILRHIHRISLSFATFTVSP